MKSWQEYCPTNLSEIIQRTVYILQVFVLFISSSNVFASFKLHYNHSSSSSGTMFDYYQTFTIIIAVRYSFVCGIPESICGCLMIPFQNSLGPGCSSSTWASLSGYLVLYYEVEKTISSWVSHHMTELFEFPNFYCLDYFGNLFHSVQYCLMSCSTHSIYPKFLPVDSHFEGL